MDMSSFTAQVVPDLLKAPAISSYLTVRRYAVDREDLKPHWKSEKRPLKKKKKTIPEPTQQNSVAAAEALSLKVSSCGTSLK